MRERKEDAFGTGESRLLDGPAISRMPRNFTSLSSLSSEKMEAFSATLGSDTSTGALDAIGYQYPHSSPHEPKRPRKKAQDRIA